MLTKDYYYSCLASSRMNKCKCTLRRCFFWWSIPILCIHLANKQHPGEYVRLEETLKTTTTTMIDKWCFPSSPCRFSHLTISALSAKMRITGSHKFEKVYVNTNAIGGAWDKIDPFRQVYNHGWKSTIIVRTVAFVKYLKKEPTKWAKTWTDQPLNSQKSVSVCVQGYWQVMDSALVRKSTMPWR